MKRLWTIITILMSVFSAGMGLATAEEIDLSKETIVIVGGAVLDDSVVLDDNSVLVDDENVMIKINDVIQDGNQLTVKLYLENRTKTTVMFALDSAVINDYYADPFWANDVAPGKRKNASITWYDLTSSGINGPAAKLQLNIRAYNDEDWFADPYLDKVFIIYPYGKGVYVSQPRQGQPTDSVIIDSDDISIIVTGYTNDDIWGVFREPISGEPDGQGADVLCERRIGQRLYVRPLLGRLYASPCQASDRHDLVQQHL